MLDVRIDGETLYDPAALADIEKFEVQLQRYLDGDLSEDAFRVFRLNNGVYGQRQGGTNQMLRIKAPHGTRSPPDQLDALALVADDLQHEDSATSRPARTSSSTTSNSTGSPTCSETSCRSA